MDSCYAFKVGKDTLQTTDEELLQKKLKNSFSKLEQSLCCCWMCLCVCCIKPLKQIINFPFHLTNNWQSLINSDKLDLAPLNTEQEWSEHQRQENQIQFNMKKTRSMLMKLVLATVCLNNAMMLSTQRRRLWRISRFVIHIILDSWKSKNIKEYSCLQSFSYIKCCHYAQASTLISPLLSLF